MKTFRWFAIVLAGLLAISFASCKKTVYHTVTFDSDGGTVVATSYQIADGETVTKPADPTKEGYTFEGWYLNDKLYDFNKGVIQDITLKAKWKAVVNPDNPDNPDDPDNPDNTVTYTVTFDSDGGTEVKSVTVKDGETVTKPADPEKEGYTFHGWYKGSKEFDFSTKVTANIKLKAHWDEIQLPSYTVTFINDNKTFKTETVKEGSTVEAPEVSKAGYSFGGWLLNDKVFDFSTKIKSNITLTASWTALPDCNVDFGITELGTMSVKNGSVLTVENTILKLKVDGAVAASASLPYTTDTVTSAILINGEAADFSSTVTVDKDMTITYQMSAGHRVNYDFNLADSHESYAAFVLNGETAQLPEKYTSETKRKTYLVTWYENAACTMKIEAATYTLISNKTLYAACVEAAVPSFAISIKNSDSTITSAFNADHTAVTLTAEISGSWYLGWFDPFSEPEPVYTGTTFVFNPQTAGIKTDENYQIYYVNNSEIVEIIVIFNNGQ